jgi:hypothetical protein
MKLVITLLLACFALFCVFGFLAGGENATPWPSRAIYGILFLAPSSPSPSRYATTPSGSSTPGARLVRELRGYPRTGG